MEKDSRPLFLSRLGGWLFRQRTWLPLPLAGAILLVPTGKRLPSPFLTLLGGALVLVGEAARLWAVHHIGVISRTRSDRLGPLIAAGPFSIVRNPLYLGNIALWLGFTLIARLPWLAPVVVLILGLEYHAIVCWEEELLTARHGDSYREYATRVPRWVPSLAAFSQPASGAPFSWRETLFSERGTLVAIALAWLLLAVKSRIGF